MRSTCRCMLYFKQVVLADGRVATCTSNKTVIEDNGTSETVHNGKLFWALRGGGGGTFGVVVHYVIKLHLAPNTYVSGLLRGILYKNESDRHILKQSLEVVEEWAKTAPNHWGGGQAVFSQDLLIYFSKLGPWDENTESEIRPILDFMSQHPQRVSLHIANFTSSADIAVHDGHPTSRMYSTGALISNTTGLWDFLVQSFMDHTDKNISAVYAVARKGGEYKWASSQENLSSGFPSKRASNRSVQLQRLSRKLKFI